MKNILRTLMVAAGLVTLAAVQFTALAGPPFLTDDPDPTDYQKFEVYLYSQATVESSSRAGTAVGLEVNYGLLPDIQISVALPAEFDAPVRSQATLGVGEAGFGVKYRFLQEDDNGWRPQVSFYPSVETALRGGVGDKATHEFLPIWAQKSFGPWTTFGGGGYRINPGSDGRNSWFAGWAVLRQINARLQLGAEVFHETAETRDGNANSGFNIAALYDINDKFHIVGSAGPSASICCKTAAFSYYLALEWTS